MNVKSLPAPIPFEMGLQIPRCVYPQAAAESVVWQSPPALRGGLPCFGPAEGMPDSRRTSEAGPCAYVHSDSSEVPGGFGDRVPEGEECDCRGSAVRPGAELHG